VTSGRGLEATGAAPDPAGIAGQDDGVSGVVVVGGERDQGVGDLLRVREACSGRIDSVA